MAHKKAGSSSKNGRDSVGQRLGVKGGDGQLVNAGSIIVRQRGMTFVAGSGTGLGRDYTVFATVPGRVRFEHVRRDKKRIRIIEEAPARARRAPDDRPPSETSSVKPDIHPTYYQATVTCASCHTTFTVGSTSPSLARGRVLQLPPVLHGQADDRRHGRPGRALPEAARALGTDLTAGSRPGAPGRLAMARFAYGGQALMEGVLMRGKDAIGVAVRGPDGQIFGAQERLNSILHRNRFARAPFFRGIVVLYETLVIGTRWLMRSGSLAAAGEGVAMGGRAVALTFASRSRSRSGCSWCCRCSSAQGATNAATSGGNAVHPAPPRGVHPGGSSSWATCSWSAARPRSARVPYHGAEHMTIHALEHDEPLTVENARRYPTAHPRCGTEFLVVFIIVSIILFSVLAGQDLLGQHPRAASCSIPVVAAVATSCSAGAPSGASNWAVRWLFLPGIWLQSITTKQPDDSIIEVAIASMQEALAANGETAPRSGSRRHPPDAHAGCRELATRDGGPGGGRGGRPRQRRGRAGPGREPRGIGSTTSSAASPARGGMGGPCGRGRSDRSRTLGREQARLAPVVDDIRQLRAARAQLAAARVERERGARTGAARPRPRGRRTSSRRRRLRLIEALRVQLLPRDPNDDRNVILEVRAGAGGDEAALFAAELLRMYVRYAERHRWGVELMSASETGIGGVKEAILEIHGDGAWSRLKFEGGVHRVQRVPATESSGRIHTSTATVAVLPEADEVDIRIDEDKDLRIEVKRSSGPAARASTRPTRPCASPTCRPASWSRSRTRRASTRTRPRRWRCCARGCSRWSSAGRTRRRLPRAAAWSAPASAPRRSRTYHFSQDRVTDHRIDMDLHDVPP